MNQLVALPMVTISGVIGGLVFLTLKPGEIEIYGKTLERRERSSSGFSLQSRVAHPQLTPDAV